MVSQYLTANVLQFAPLGVNWKSVVSQAATAPTQPTTGQIYAELTNIILRASALMDTYCQQVLAATTDSEEKRADDSRSGIDRNGYLWVHTDYWPVRSVSSFQYGYPALGGTTWTVSTLSDLLLYRSRIVYPGLLPRRGVPPLRIQYTYVNGWPTTLLTASTIVGATALPVADATGMVAGQSLTVYDGGNTETVTVAGTWTATTGAASVTLAAGMSFAHTIAARTAPQPYDVLVSALPPDVQTACLLICKELAEERGASALVMGRTGGVAGVTPRETAAEKVPMEAQFVLDAYRRVI